ADPRGGLGRQRGGNVPGLEAAGEEGTSGTGDEVREFGEADPTIAVDHRLGVAETLCRVANHGGNGRPADLAAHVRSPRSSARMMLTDFESVLLPMQLLHEDDYQSLPVVDVVEETADTRSFVLEIPPDLEEKFTYAAGQFCTFRAAIDEEPVVRCYSMSSSPDVPEPFMTTVKRVAGGRMSNWMNDSLAPGDAIEVLRPSGLFVLHDNEAPIVAFAGGSGITPVISIVKSALATTDRRIALVYANRSADMVIFADDLERLRSTSNGRLSIHHHLDSERGFLDAAQCAALAGDDADADFYLCGPPPYMDMIEAGLSTPRGAPHPGCIGRVDLPRPPPPAPHGP